jgi:KaiC/GvpD/RAD55 family RecA-like ATPase
MPPTRTDLLEKLIGSETKAELLMYFHDNPDSTDTIEGIANKIKRSPKEIERDVSDLVELGLLTEVRVISFSKNRDQELQKEISQRLVSVGSLEETSASSNRDLTGVGMIDSLLPDGYPSSSVVIVMGDPATGKTTLLVQLVAEALKRGRNVVYAALDDFPDSIRESMKLMGVNPKDYEVEGRRKLVFIDCYSFLVGVRSQEQYSEDPQRLSDLSIVVTKALSEARESSNVMLAMDSLTTLIQRSGVRPSFDFLHTLIAKIRSNRASCVTSLSRKAFHPAIIAALQDKVDGVIEMKVEDTKDGLARFIRISKMKGAQHITTWTPYNRDPSMGLIIPYEEPRVKKSVQSN